MKGAPAFSNPRCLFIPDWNSSDWHTHSHTQRQTIVCPALSGKSIQSNLNPTTQCDMKRNFQIWRAESRWYSQSLGIPGDIPWHGPETQSVAVHCGAAAGTQRWAGTRITHEQSREHHQPHPEGLPGQPTQECPKTVPPNGHVHQHWSLLLHKVLRHLAGLSARILFLVNMNRRANFFFSILAS